MFKKRIAGRPGFERRLGKFQDGGLKVRFQALIEWNRIDLSLFLDRVASNSR